MTTEQQLMVSSNSASGVPIDDKSFVRKPEDVLDKLGTRHKGLITAIVSCSFVWGFGALSIMSSAFTSIDCGNCTDTMLTVVSEFGLRGDRAYLAEWSTSFFMIGNMIGGCTLSHAADRFGRRPILLLCLTFQALSALLASFSKSVHIFSICRLLQGACYTGANLVAWVAAYEHTHTDFRSFTTFFFGATWVIGYSAVALMVYLSSTWRQLMIATALSTLVFTVWCWRFVPETLHFLVSKRNTARIHKWFVGIEYSPHHTDITNLLHRSNDSPSSQSGSFFHEVWKHKIFIAYCIIQLYLWTCDNFIYFGLSLYSTQLAGNRYANYLLMGLVELPAYILGPISLERFGRKVVVSGTHFLAAACFLLPVFSEGCVQQEWSSCASYWLRIDKIKTSWNSQTRNI
ncbi:hypothetical protein Y032_0070g425 [Ancylostoma ceylanicum]|uniref:Major facilitator superfamily (MFS) profile domain-containing protein n=2 Tax=Ancylostoma ceylanicum TaxID=53326 RepID=A0A016TX90_9BILA|nr:hypothetical protein Y032_0070g425 [Ancylostoma ceylanicum]